MENHKRIKAIDFARGISVLMLAVVHTLWIYGSIDTQTETWLGSAIHLIGKGTPMFLIAMGVSFTLSRNQSILLSIKRALYILALGYFMNFMKFILPVLVGIIPNNFIEAYGWSAPVTFDNMLYMLGTGDILQLAGVSLVLMGIINRFSKNKYIPLFLALIIAVLTKEVHGFQLDIVGVDYLLDLLWGAGWNVYFAVFPWFSFILIGMFFGMWYKEKSKSTEYLFKKMLIGGIILMSIGGILCYINFEYHFGDYFHLGPGGVLYLTGFNLVALWGANLYVTRIRENRFLRFLYYCSKRVTTIYIIQWVIICWGMGILGYQQFGVIEVLLLIPLFLGITFGIQKLILDKIKSSKRTKKKTNNTLKKQVFIQKT